MSQMEQLLSELARLSKINSVAAILGWDEEVNMPPKAHPFRGEVKAMVSAEAHQRFTDPSFVALVKKLAEDSQKLNPDQLVIVRETWRDVSRAVKLPVSFVEKLSRLTTESFAAWADARQKSDFKLFEPYLERILTMKRQEAELLGYQESPYDALIDNFEPNMTSTQLEELFKPLASSLSKFIKAKAASELPQLPKVDYPLDIQTRLTQEVAAAMGYDMGAGRIDVSPHPFTVTFHPTDVRITTRYDLGDFWVALGSTIHEVGHALYEQNLPAKHFGTPLGEAVSLGVHESQSRIWENFVGRSLEFSQWLQPLLVKQFGKQMITYGAEQLYLWLNRVQPSLIRVEADEVTYNLHIILRFELEKDLIENQLKVADLPVAWNQKIKDYLGLKVPNDSQGVLQDVHWSHGYFGYFPTYSLGNLYAAQLYQAAQKAIPNLEDGFAKGDFNKFLNWLKKDIHAHGRRYQAEELIKRASGEPPNPQYLKQHLAAKVNLS